jgi:hypothetical protein
MKYIVKAFERDGQELEFDPALFLCESIPFYTLN